MVNLSSHLQIIWRLHKLHPNERIGRDDPRAMSRFGTPGDEFALCISDTLVRLGGTPDAKVVKGIDDGGLAEGVLVFSGRVATVVARLDTTGTVRRVNLFGLIEEVESDGSTEERRGTRTIWSKGIFFWASGMSVWARMGVAPRRTRASTLYMTKKGKRERVTGLGGDKKTSRKGKGLCSEKKARAAPFL